MRKIIAVMLAVMVSMTLSFGSIVEAKSSGGGRSSGYSRSSAPRTSAPKTNTSGYKASSSKASSPKGNTSGYKAKGSNTAPKGSSYPTNGGGKVTSGGGNTSGYKSKQTQTKEQAHKNMASNSSSGSHWFVVTNYHYYGGGYDGGIGHFATGILFGSLLCSPWHVYAGAPGYYGGGYVGGIVPGGGYYSPFTGLLGILIWIVQWAVIIGLLWWLGRFIYRRYKRRKE